jgi:pyruvate formate lyase activating enzyme
VAACPEHALSLRAEGIHTDLALCQRCGQCVESCPTISRTLIGRSLSVPELLAEIEKDRPYYDESGGGVTFSGGEPLLQPTFLLAALAECGARDIHRTVDTAGLAPRDVLEAVAAQADLFLYDLKLLDEARHRAATGASNVAILTNLEHLVATGAEVRVRIPLIHGINDDDGNIDATAMHLRSLEGVRHVDLLPFHRPAADKHRKFGLPWRMNGDATTSDERLRQIEARFVEAGFDVTIGG